MIGKSNLRFDGVRASGGVFIWVGRANVKLYVHRQSCSILCQRSVIRPLLRFSISL